MGMGRHLRFAVLAALPLAVAAPARAAERIEGVNPDVFRTLQYILGQAGGAAFNDAQVTMLGRAIARDDQVDEAERKLADALARPAYDLVIAARQTAIFKPNDLSLKGSLPASARAIITQAISPAGLAADKARRMGPEARETWSAFHLRSGEAGVAGLVAHARKSPANWTEARNALAARYGEWFAQGSWTSGHAVLRGELERNRGLIAAMPAEQRQSAVLLHLEACALADANSGGKIPQALYASAFGVAPADVAALAARIGIPAARLDPVAP